MEKNELKTIGILGGMSSAATGEYYKLINQKVKEIKGGHNIAEMVICSVNFANIERYVRTNNWEEAANYLVEKAIQLEKSGAVCLFLGTNTMHKVREQIKDAISIPFIDIFETVSKKIKSEGKTKIGMLGTYPVMNDPFYTNAYKEYGIELINPKEVEKIEIDRILFDELTNHIFLDSSKEYFINVIKNLYENGAEGIILGCTEIKLLISQNDIKEVPLFNTTDLHCELAAKICTGEIELIKNVW
jgi:aspartate racemase